jgi:hypothetical protein
VRHGVAEETNVAEDELKEDEHGSKFWGNTRSAWSWSMDKDWVYEVWC